MKVAQFRLEWTACAAIAQHAWHARANQGNNALTWLFVGLAILCPLLALGFKAPVGRAIGFGVGIPLAVVVVIWWSLLVLSINSQQCPAQSRLVPRLRQRHMMVLSLGWAGATIGLTLLFAWAGLPMLTVGGVAGLALVVIALINTMPLIGFLVGMLVLNTPLLPIAVPDVVNIMTTCAVLIPLCAYVVLRVIYTRANSATAKPGTWKESSDMMFSRNTGPAFARIFQRDCARRDIGPMLLHSIGPAGHAPGFSTPLPMLASLAGLAVVACLLVLVPSLGNYVVPVRLAAAVIVIIFQFGMPMRIFLAVQASIGEQGLVRLAPRAPRSGLFNAPLAQALQQQFGAFWVRTTIALLLVSAALGARGDELLRLAVVCLMSLSGAGVLLHDYASRRRPGRWDAVYGFWGLGAAGLALAAASASLRIEFWLALGVLAVAGALVFWRLRWHAMLRAPAAFPAGRCS